MPKPKDPIAAPKDYLLEVELLESQPPVTRKFVVSGERTLGELHRILQAVMGWENCHLHGFNKADGRRPVSDPTLEGMGAEDEGCVLLREYAIRKGIRFLYEYDFGDGWTHEVRVLERMDPDPEAPEPRCIEGKNACPPEDSGGVCGYTRRLEVLKDPEHLDYDDVSEWMGEEFDAHAFDLERVNDRLRSQLVRTGPEVVVFGPPGASREGAVGKAVSLEELASHVGDVMYDLQVLFNRTTGEVAVYGDDMDLDDEEDFDAPEWIWVPYPDEDSDWRIMRDFARQQESPEVRERLWSALNRSRPFSRFRDEVRALDLGQAWYPFQESQVKDLVRVWLEVEGIPWTD